MNTELQSQQDISDRYLAAVAAAGQAVFAVRSGLGVSAIGIERGRVGDETPYRSLCTPRRPRGAASTLRFILAGEAAQAALGLKSFEEVCLLTTHAEAAHVIRAWDGYWGSYPHFYSLHDDWAADAVEEESVHLIWLARWQTCRHMRYERSAIERVALEIRDGKMLSGIEAERFVRNLCSAENTKLNLDMTF